MHHLMPAVMWIWYWAARAGGADRWLVTGHCILAALTTLTYLIWCVVVWHAKRLQRQLDEERKRSGAP